MRAHILINACVSATLFIGIHGCMVGPDFHRPAAAVSSDWMEAGDERVRTGAADYRNWWRVFDDPVLNRIIDMAYKENLTLRIAGVRVLEARAQLGIAAGRFFPQTQQVTGSIQYNKLSPAAAQTSPVAEFTEDQIGAGATWELDFWGKFRRGIESADASWLASAANYDNAMVSLAADAAGSYISIRTLERRISIACLNAETQKENLGIVEARFRHGTVTLLDVEQAKAQLANTLASIPSLETLLQQQKDSLCVLLGMAPNDLKEVLGGPSKIPVSPRAVIVGIPADLLRRRPDIHSAELQAAAQSAQIGVAKADLYPAISINGTISFISSNIGNSKLADMFMWKNRAFQAGPSFEWNFLNYGRITNNIRFQDALLQELIIAYQQTVLSAQQEVEDNLAAFLKAQERAALLAQSTEAAKLSLDLSVRQYREGLKDFTSVLIAQQTLLSEQDSLASALGDISQGLVGVYRALGGGWEIRKGMELLPQDVKEEMAKRTDWGNLLDPAAYNPPVTAKPDSSIQGPDW